MKNPLSKIVLLLNVLLNFSVPKSVNLKLFVKLF